MVDRSNKRMMQRGSIPPVTRGCMNAVPSKPSNNGGSCASGGSCGGVNSDCKSLMRRLQTVEFSMYDTMLYLDIYPECREALAYYEKLREERDALRASLAKRCKRPTTAPENEGGSWDWIASPWPWDPSAN